VTKPGRKCERNKLPVSASLRHLHWLRWSSHSL